MKLGRHVIFAVLLFTVALPASADDQLISAQEMLGLSPLEDAQRLSYGPIALNSGELRIPPGDGPFPAAIVIHGGCWLSFADLHIMDRVAATLTRSGVATWNVEYRRVDNEGGGWPGTFLDVARAADHDVGIDRSRHRAHAGTDERLLSARPQHVTRARLPGAFVAACSHLVARSSPPTCHGFPRRVSCPTANAAPDVGRRLRRHRRPRPAPRRIR